MESYVWFLIIGYLAYAYIQAVFVARALGPRHVYDVGLFVFLCALAAPFVSVLLIIEAIKQLTEYLVGF